MDLDEASISRLEQIEKNGFSGIHPIIENNSKSIKKIELDLKSSCQDVAQLSSVLGKNCCIMFFDENGFIDSDISTASNVTSSLILESFCNDHLVHLAHKYMKNWSAEKLQERLKNVATKWADTRHYFHQTDGDTSTSGLGEAMGSSSVISRKGTSAIMEFFAKINNSGEDIGEVTRKCVREYQTEEKNKFVQECEVILFNMMAF
jgi:hypothetical protein